MKFVFNGDSLVIASAPPQLIPDAGQLLKKGVDTADQWAFEKFMNLLVKFLNSIFSKFWDWFIMHLPDIMGYFTVAAGVSIVLGAMIGRGGMMKPLAIYAGLLIMAFLILGGV